MLRETVSFVTVVTRVVLGQFVVLAFVDLTLRHFWHAGMEFGRPFAVRAQHDDLNTVFGRGLAGVAAPDLACLELLIAFHAVFLRIEFVHDDSS